MEVLFLGTQEDSKNLVCFIIIICNLGQTMQYYRKVCAYNSGKFCVTEFTIIAISCPIHSIDQVEHIPLVKR
jgi:hypothetical protein